VADFLPRELEREDEVEDGAWVDPARIVRREVHWRMYINALAINERLTKIEESLGQEGFVGFVNFFLHMCPLITTTVTMTSSSAVRMFAVMNSRGINLSTVDTIRPALCERLPLAERAELLEEWDRMREHLGTRGFEDFFKVFRLTEEAALLAEGRNDVQVYNARLEDNIIDYFHTKVRIGVWVDVWCGERMTSGTPPQCTRQASENNMTLPELVAFVRRMLEASRSYYSLQRGFEDHPDEQAQEAIRRTNDLLAFLNAHPAPTLWRALASQYLLRHPAISPRERLAFVYTLERFVGVLQLLEGRLGAGELHQFWHTALFRLARGDAPEQALATPDGLLGLLHRVLSDKKAAAALHSRDLVKYVLLRLEYADAWAKGRNFSPRNLAWQ
jgi:hypothetical protein